LLIVEQAANFVAFVIALGHRDPYMPKKEIVEQGAHPGRALLNTGMMTQP